MQRQSIGLQVRAMAADLTSWGITSFARILTAVQPVWQGFDPSQRRQRIYFANHVSHGDFVLIWTVLPQSQRRRTRPVAGADYWRKGGMRQFIGSDVFNSLLIERNRDGVEDDPIAQMATALDQGASLIIFPEGTRNLTDAPLLPLKSGIFHLAHAAPRAEIVPAWILNLDRILPKGAVVPVPLNCAVRFGQPMRPAEGEDRDSFLARLGAAMLALSDRS